MGTDHKKTPLVHKDKQEQASNFKAFVRSTEGGGQPEWKQQKATGTNNFLDEQNKLIDKHNLRK